jgi:hypothetical protein
MIARGSRTEFLVHEVMHLDLVGVAKVFEQLGGAARRYLMPHVA